MKDIRPQFTEEDQPLCSTRLLCIEMAKYRNVLNKIILRETKADVRLYEDDIIRMEMSVAGLENIVANFVNAKLKEAK